MYLVVLMASLLVFFGVTATFVKSRAFSAFHPLTLYIPFHGLVFVIRPLLSVWLDYEAVYLAHEFMPTEGERITAILVANLGFLSFAFFSLRQGSVEMRFRSDPLLEDERVRLTRYFTWVMVLCFPVAVLSLLTLYNAAFSYDAYSDMVLDRASGISYNTKGNGYFNEAQLMLVPLCAIVAWVFRFRLLALMPLLLFVLFRASTGGRGPFVAALVAAGLFYLYSVRRKFPTFKFTMIVLMAGALFVAVGQDRGYALRTALGAQTDIRVSTESDLKFMEGMDFANMEFLEYLVQVIPARTGTYGYFNEVLQLFTEPIPRVLWPGKPIGAPFQTFSLFDYGYPIGATRSLPGAGWYGLGWLGVVFWCGLWGYVLGLVYRRFVESDQSTFKVAAYLCFLPILIVAYRDGLIVTVFRQGIFYLAPIGLWIVIARYFNVPLARDVRAAMNLLRRRSARGNDQAEADRPAVAIDPGEPQQADLRHLPPAVRRRRIALSSKA